MVLAGAASLSSAVRAGTLPDITGTWYANGASSKRCEISQSGTSVRLRNEQGKTATGFFTNPSTLTSDWGYFGARNITGAISPNLRRISWSNGTFWTRPFAPAPVPPPTPNPYRDLRFTTATLAPERGPIAVYGGWGAVKRDGKEVVVCISFKNERQVAATRIRFEFPLANREGETLDTLQLDRRGTFSTNVNIDGWSGLEAWRSGVGHRGYADNCVIQRSGIAALSLMNAHFASYRIRRVEFADGSIWPAPGTQP
jgi:hypothetical protein